FNRSLADLDLENLFLTAVGGSLPCPIVGTQPASQTVLSGQQVQFSVVASGGLPLAYQWQAGAVGSGLFTNVLDGGAAQVSGSTTASLIISNVLSSADYRVLLTNNNSSCGNVYSST